MIAKLSGRIDSVGDDWVIVDVGGVGYLVGASSRTLGGVRVGEAASLLVETHVREDRIQLFGFASRVERDWFRLLLTVQGVGAKVALGLLSAVPAERMAPAIVSGDKAALTRAPGIGPKLAQRILSELRDKVAALEIAMPSGRQPGQGAPTRAGAATSVQADAVSALVNLGYSPTDAFAAIVHAKTALGDAAGIEALIRAGLGELEPRDVPRGSRP